MSVFLVAGLEEKVLYSGPAYAKYSLLVVSFLLLPRPVML